MIGRRAPIRRSPIKKREPKRSAKRLPPVEYAALRAAVLARDHWACQAPITNLYQMPGPIDPHHIIFRSQGGEDTMENLITLCRYHHDEIHARRLWIIGDATNAKFTTLNPKHKGATQ